MKKLILFILIFPLFLSAKIQVTTYFPLETQFIKKIAKQEVEVAQISHRFSKSYSELPPSGLKKLSSSKIFFHFGLDIENDYEKVLKQNNQQIIVVNLSKNIPKLGLNPYIWMDPFAIKIVAKNIFDSLVEIDIKNQQFYKKNYEEFLNEIDEAFLTILQNLNKSKVNSFYAIDDYWDYFANRFRLEVIKKDKKMFSTNELKDLSNTYKNKDTNKLLYCYPKDQNRASTLARSLNAKPVENDIFNEDWQTNLINLSNSIIK